MIGIIDYGMGNIHSVRKALEFMGGTVEVTSDPARLGAFDKLVLPGVGAFGDAMVELQSAKLADAIRETVSAGTVLLGICLGMHLLFASSEESPGVRGLGILEGSVKKFAVPGLKVPHMGWNTLRTENPCPLLKGIAEASVYFCHSYYPDCPQEIRAASTEYGVSFASVIREGNVFACQFHPEKSQEAGLKILKNFVQM
jgi:glutamine amidotransferase